MRWACDARNQPRRGSAPGTVLRECSALRVVCVPFCPAALFSSAHDFEVAWDYEGPVKSRQSDGRSGSYLINSADGKWIFKSVLSSEVDAILGDNGHFLKVCSGARQGRCRLLRVFE